MRKYSKVWTLLILLLACVAAGAQTVTINGSVVDRDGIGWVNGTYRVTLLYKGGQQPTDLNGAYIQTLYQGYLGTGGSINITIQDTNYTRPSNAQWQFKFCPAVYGISCNQPQLTEAVTAGNVSGIFTQITAAIPVPRISGGQNSFAYDDVEVAGTANNSYQNTLTAPGLRCYTAGTGWASCGGTGGGATFPSTPGLVWNTSTTASRTADALDIANVLGYTPLAPDAIAATTNVLKGVSGGGSAVAATPGTDYVIPSGNVATATALASTPTLCSAGNYPLGVLANGNAVGCAAAGAAFIPATMAVLRGNGTTGQSQASLYTDSGTAGSYTGTSGFSAVSLAINGLNYPTTAASGGVVYASSTSQLAVSAALTSNSPVLGGGAGAAPKTVNGISSDGVSKMILGAAGTSVGGVQLFNATSGSVTLQPTTGALGTVTASLPANTGTVAETNLAQSFTVAQTFTSILAQHITGTGTSPTIASGSGAGTTATVTMVSGATDHSGYFTVLTGSSVAPSATATVAIITFNTAYTAAPPCSVWPANAATQALVGAAAPQVYAAGVATSSFILTSGSTALGAGTFEWGYRCG